MPHESKIETSLTGISILKSRPDSHQNQAVCKRKFEPELECKAVPTVPQLASSAARGHATPENAIFPIDSADTSPPPQRRHRKSPPPCGSPIPRATATSRSCAAYQQTAGASDGSPQAAASSNVRA